MIKISSNKTTQKEDSGVKENSKIIVEGKEVTVQELWRKQISTFTLPEDIALAIFDAFRKAPNGLLKFNEIADVKNRVMTDSGKKRRFNPWKLVEHNYIIRIPIKKGSKRYVYGMTPKATEYIKLHQESKVEAK